MGAFLSSFNELRPGTRTSGTEKYRRNRSLFDYPVLLGHFQFLSETQEDKGVAEKRSGPAEGYHKKTI
jgi:hypothetical protein